jgi:hypothetical protein
VAEVAERLRLTLDLAELAEDMLRQKLRRDRPRRSGARIEAEIDAWYSRRPGAERGDAVGRLRPWPPAHD